MILKAGKFTFQAEHVTYVKARETETADVTIELSSGTSVRLTGPDAAAFLDQWDKVVAVNQVLAENQAIQLQMQQQVAQAMQAKQAYEQALQKSGAGRILIPH